jgi:hypothetical protein
MFMRTHILPAIGLSAAALAIATTAMPGASAAGSHITLSHQSTAGAVQLPGSPDACYAQLDNDNGIGIVSQKFEGEYKEYRSQGADDFTLKTRCTVQSVDAVGVYFSGSGPLDNAHVVFYHEEGGTPGLVIARRIVPASKITDDGFGSFHVPFRTPVALDAGVYWVGFRVRMDFSAGGEWGWNTNNTVRGNPSVWKNRGDGFATGCKTYTETTVCIPSGEGGDFTFALNDSP